MTAEAVPEPARFQSSPGCNSTRRLRLFVWGDSGVDETPFAPRFRNSAVIDLDGGTRAGQDLAAIFTGLLRHILPNRRVTVRRIADYQGGGRG